MTFATLGDIYNAYDGPIPQHVKEDNFHIFPEYHPDRVRKARLAGLRKYFIGTMDARRSWKKTTRYPEPARVEMIQRMTVAAREAYSFYQTAKETN